MTLRFKILGYEIATLALEIDETTPTLTAAPVVARGVKWISNQWLKGMTK